MYRYLSSLVGVGVVLAIPVMVFAKGGGVPNTSMAVGPLVFIAIAAWGIFKCFKISKRKTTNAKCAVALGLSLTGYLVVSFAGLLKPFGAYSPIIVAIGLFLSVVLFIVSFVLAIIGLVEYKQGFTQGHKQAVWAIVINSLFIVLVMCGVIMGVAKHVDGQKSKYVKKETVGDIVDADLNFKVGVPDKPYIQLKPKVLNPYATAAFMRTKPQLYYMLIAERGGVDMEMTTEDLLEVSQASLKSNAEDLDIGKPEVVRINGLDGLQYRSDAVVGGKKLSYVHWVSSVNGYLYQQVAFAERKNNEILISESKELFANFQQIEPDKVCYSVGADPFGRYESKQFGYALDLRNASWTKWPKLKEKLPGADTGGLTGTEVAAFAISAIPLAQDTPGHEAVIGGFLHSLGIDRKEDHFQLISDKTQAGHTDFLFKHAKTEDNTKIAYQIKITIYDDRAYMLAVWSDKDIAEVEGFYEQVEPSLVYSIPNRSNHNRELDGQGKLAAADIINRIGIWFEKNKNDQKASEYFSAAVAYDPTDGIFWDNLMSSMNELKEHEKAVVFVEKYKDTIKLKDATRSWYAWHLLKSGKKPEALEVYQSLFASGFDSEEDFKYYVNLLAELGTHEQIDPAYERFLKEEKNIELRLHQADVWYREKQYPKALAVLDKMDPKLSKVMLEKIYNYREMNRHKEILTICDQLIGSNQSLGDAYYHKGRAEYELKWYAKSKHSFEKSLIKYPNNQNIKDYLKELSGILGQGDNSAIKKKIKPVELPNKLKAYLDGTVDPAYIKGEGAYYLRHVLGYQQDKKGLIKYTMRRKVHIVNSVGANNFSTFTIDFNPLYEQLYVNSLVVRSPEGDVIAQGDVNNYYIVDLYDSDEKSHMQTLNMPIPQLIPGCTFEIVATKILGNYDAFPFRKNILASSYPIVSGMVYLLCATEDVHMKVANGAQLEMSEGVKLAYIHSPRKYRREPKQLNYNYELPLAYMCGKGATWQTQGEEYLDKIKKQMVITDDVKKLARRLTKGIDQKDHKVEKLYGYLQANYKYMGIEFGSRGQIPYEASKTVQNRYGDCKDHAVLFHHLLESVGVENYLALVNSSHAIQEDMPSRDQFNHLINYIPGDNSRFWDATDKYCSTSLITPTDLSGFQALVLEPDNVRFIRIPEYKTDDALIHVDRTYHIEGRTLFVKETLQLQGYFAGFMRNFLKRKNMDAQQAWGQSTIQSYYPSGKLETFRVDGLADNNEPIKLEFEYSVLRKVHSIKEGLIVNTGGIWEPYYLFSEDVKNRQTKFEVDFPFRFTSNNTFEIPDGFAIKALPKTFSPRPTAFGVLETTSDKTEKRVQFQVRLEAKKGIFPKDQYREYFNFNQKCIETASPNLVFTEL